MKLSDAPGARKEFSKFEAAHHFASPIAHLKQSSEPSHEVSSYMTNKSWSNVLHDKVMGSKFSHTVVAQHQGQNSTRRKSYFGMYSKPKRELSPSKYEPPVVKEKKKVE